MARDLPRAARAIDEFLDAMGVAHDPAVAGTGARVADAWDTDLLAGYAIDTTKLLVDESFETSAPGALVLMRDVAVATTCPHHLMPAIGTATFAYLPGGRVAGLGTLVRTLHAFSRRLTLQEEIGQAFVDALFANLHARGAACVLRLRHTCLAARGERDDSVVETLATSGSLSLGGADAALLVTLLGPR